MDLLTPLPARGTFDPAVLAFVKCHLTSFLRWDLLRIMADAPDRWFDPSDLARLLRKPVEDVQAGLDQLADESVLEARPDPHGAAAFRLDPDGPSTRVVERLVLSARRSHELREIILARVLGASRQTPPGSVA